MKKKMGKRKMANRPKESTIPIQATPKCVRCNTFRKRLLKYIEWYFCYKYLLTYSAITA